MLQLSAIAQTLLVVVLVVVSRRRHELGVPNGRRLQRLLHGCRVAYGQGTIWRVHAVFAEPTALSCTRSHASTWVGFASDVVLQLLAAVHSCWKGSLSDFKGGASSRSWATADSCIVWRIVAGLRTCGTSSLC
jgi:hypothetical protein